MTQIVTNQGQYFDYRCDVLIYYGKNNSHQIMLYSGNHIDCDYEITSNDESSPSQNTVTLYNITKSTLAKIKAGEKIIIKSGPADAYGILARGFIVSVKDNNSQDEDDGQIITFSEGTDYSKAEWKGASKAKTSKSSTKKKAVKMLRGTPQDTVLMAAKKKSTKKTNAPAKGGPSFKGRVSAKHIISKICHDSGIKLVKTSLGKNTVFKHGYSINDTPIGALKDIAGKCASQLYYRPDGLAIESTKKPNAYKNHIRLDANNGLIFTGPTQDNDSDDSSDDSSSGTNTWTMTGFDDPRLYAGQTVYIASKNLTGLHRIKSVVHRHEQDLYEMDVVVYA